MYTVVLMAALGGGVDVPDCGHRHGCCGGCYGGCWGGCCGGYGGCWGGCYGGGYGGCCGGGYGGYAYGGWGRGYAYGGYPGSYGMVYSNGTAYPSGQMTVSGYYSPQSVPLPTWSNVNEANRLATGAGTAGETMPRPSDGNAITPAAAISPDYRGLAGAPQNGLQPRANIPAPARIVVSLPADARLMIEDEPTSSTTGDRTFVSPPLQPGKPYFYSLKAELDRNGKKETVSQNVEVRAGQESRVTLQFPGEAPNK